MSIEIVPVKTKTQKKLFVDLEWQLNAQEDNWVSPLRMERFKLIDTVKNPFYQHAEIQCFVAFKDGEAVGRIAAITNQNHNDFHNDTVGFWGFFDSINDQKVADSLFASAASWLKGKDKSDMIGPMNPSTNDEAGILIDGFDTKPYIMMRHNPKFYATLVEGFGSKKVKDIYAWIVPTAKARDNISDKMKRVSAKILQRHDISVRTIKVKNLKEEIKLVKEVYNDAWSENWGFVPFTDAEIDYIAADLKPIANEELLFIAEKNGKPVGFSVTLPNVNEALDKLSDGRLLPFGLFKLLRGMKKIKNVRVVILGIKKELQATGLGSVFYIKSITRANELGYIHGEMSWILEDNHAMNRAIESIGSERYKTYRLYSFPLKDDVWIV